MVGVIFTIILFLLKKKQIVAEDLTLIVFCVTGLNFGIVLGHFIMGWSIAFILLIFIALQAILFLGYRLSKKLSD